MYKDKIILHKLLASTHKKVSVKYLQQYEINKMENTLECSLSDKLQRGEVFSNACPSREIFNHITNKWGCLCLVALLNGTMRFSDMRRKLNGISEKMLAQTLQILEKDGFINRVAYPVIPPHTEYSLTPLGEEIAKRLESLIDWLESNIGVILENQHK